MAEASSIERSFLVYLKTKTKTFDVASNDLVVQCRKIALAVS